jgi:hypothetical protein
MSAIPQLPPNINTNTTASINGPILHRRWEDGTCGCTRNCYIKCVECNQGFCKRSNYVYGTYRKYLVCDECLPIHEQKMICVECKKSFCGYPKTDYMLYYKKDERGGYGDDEYLVCNMCELTHYNKQYNQYNQTNTNTIIRNIGIGIGIGIGISIAICHINT